MLKASHAEIISCHATPCHATLYYTIIRHTRPYHTISNRRQHFFASKDFTPRLCVLSAPSLFRLCKASSHAQFAQIDHLGLRRKTTLISRGWLSPQTNGSPHTSCPGILFRVNYYYVDLTILAPAGRRSGDQEQGLEGSRSIVFRVSEIFTACVQLHLTLLERLD